MTQQTDKPLVGVIMGSDSDYATMRAAVAALREFDVPCEVRVVSAHRTPDDMAEYARTAASRGLLAIIAGAGGAAHLPGMVASHTPLPVVGVPVESHALRGMDSLLSIVQMPAGVPVATVGIGNARNAGLLGQARQTQNLGLRLDIQANAASVHQRKFNARPLGSAVQAVARGTRRVVDDGIRLADQAIEQGGFAHVGSAHKGYHWQRHG